MMPRLSKRKRFFTKMKRKYSNKKCYIKGPKGLATIIVNNARRIGLQVCANDVAPGDGNCFYHAVLQQLHRNDIHASSDVTPLCPLPTHLELRVSICQYVLQHQNDIPYILHYKTLYDNVLHEEYNMTWDEFLADQSNNGVHATELFIKSMAVFIGHNINITTEYCTTAHPYNVITSTWNDTDGENQDNTILIGNIYPEYIFNHCCLQLPCIPMCQLYKEHEYTKCVSKHCTDRTNTIAIIDYHQTNPRYT